MIYLIDTSSLVCLTEKYPEDVFKSLYKNMENEIKKDTIKTPIQVLHEIKKRDDMLYNWLKDKKKFFIKTTEEIFQKAFQIIKIYPELIKNLGLNNNGDDPADPYLISTAIILNKENIYGEAQIKIITEEGTKKNHIPDIANKYNIKSLHILEFFKENNWQF
jgi:hypothetical protein